MSDEGGIEWEMERDPDLIEEPVMKLDTQVHTLEHNSAKGVSFLLLN